METYVHGTEVETQDAEVLWGGKKGVNSSTTNPTRNAMGQKLFPI